MELALSGHSFAPAQPLDEDIRVAALTGFPWLVVPLNKLESYLQQPDLDIRDLKRLFLRTQPAAVEQLYLPDSDPAHLPAVEALCKEARRLGAPVLMLHVAALAPSLGVLADAAKRWSTVLGLVPAADEQGPTFDELRDFVQRLNHEAVGWVVDPVALWRSGQRLQAEDAHRTVLLLVYDLNEEGDRVLPGQGVVPLVELLEPLFQGGYDGIAVLSMEGAPPPDEPLALGEAGRNTLATVLRSVGWEIPPWSLDNEERESL